MLVWFDASGPDRLETLAKHKVIFLWQGCWAYAGAIGYEVATLSYWTIAALQLASVLLVYVVLGLGKPEHSGPVLEHYVRERLGRRLWQRHDAAFAAAVAAGVVIANPSAGVLLQLILAAALGGLAGYPWSRLRLGKASFSSVGPDESVPEAGMFYASGLCPAPALTIKRKDRCVVGSLFAPTQMSVGEHRLLQPGTRVSYREPWSRMSNRWHNYFDASGLDGSPSGDRRCAQSDLSMPRGWTARRLESWSRTK